MDAESIEHSVAYCGLVCALCRPNDTCNCRAGNCGKRLSPEGCYQYDCCTSKNLSGCWECGDFPCGRDMLADSDVKIRAFIRCIKENGIEKFCSYLINNLKNGIMFHREGFIGDYDLEDEASVLKLLRNGKCSA